MKNKTYKITVKIQPPSGYKTIYKRGLCLAKTEQEAKDWTLKMCKDVDFDVPVTITIHKCEKLPTQFIFNTESPS